MSSYTIIMSKRARKDLDKLDNKTVKPILNAIGKLADDSRPNGYKKTC